ncbi:MAG: primosomal protein N' [Christensenellales bacterium]
MEAHPNRQSPGCHRAALGGVCPIQNLGLIIIDEEHEQSYRSEHKPQYTRTKWRKNAVRFRSHAGLGSATPSVVTYHRCMEGEYTYLSLPNRATGQAMPKVYVSDMRDELKRGNRSIFSALYHAMETCLDQKEQMMLFINRRGYATFLMCRGCGYVVQCPDCDVSMTYHRSAYREELRCHYCGKTMQPPALCPVCGKPYLKQFGIGTQQVEEQVKLHFPEARVLRMDADTTKGKDAHLKILQAFSQKQADVLIGTQMIAKGHDFENVTLVGVLAADSSLYVPDYRSAERTFQLITQVAEAQAAGPWPVRWWCKPIIRIILPCSPPSSRIIASFTRRKFCIAKRRSFRRMRSLSAFCFAARTRPCKRPVWTASLPYPPILKTRRYPFAV